MVAKLYPKTTSRIGSLNLAKIHMVAKLQIPLKEVPNRLNLAKIHMVAKPALNPLFL